MLQYFWSCFSPKLRIFAGVISFRQRDILYLSLVTRLMAKHRLAKKSADIQETTIHEQNFQRFFPFISLCMCLLTFA